MHEPVAVTPLPNKKKSLAMPAADTSGRLGKFHRTRNNADEGDGCAICSSQVWVYCAAQRQLGAKATARARQIEFQSMSRVGHEDIAF